MFFWGVKLLKKKRVIVANQPSFKTTMHIYVSKKKMHIYVNAVV